MYTPNAWGAYCSEIAPNINTLAFLKVEECGIDSSGTFLALKINPNSQPF
jgi:hypothetical protein